MKTALFWAVTQRGVVIPYRRFGTTGTETSVSNHHPSQCNSPEEPIRQEL
jgi:hypothetical protein